jgi:hypothetical protein
MKITGDYSLNQRLKFRGRKTLGGKKQRLNIEIRGLG